jgi:hypothetical protein
LEAPRLEARRFFFAGSAMTSSPRRRIDVAGLAIAIILLVLAGVIWWDMSKLQILSLYDLSPRSGGTL